MLRPYSLPLREHIPHDPKEHHTESHQNEEWYPWSDIRSSLHSIAKAIDHIEDRIRMRNCLPCLWKHLDRVEYSSEICEWREDKIRNDRSRVKTISHQTVEESDKREQQWSEECEDEHESDMFEMNIGEEKGNTEDNRTRHEPANHSSRDKSCDHDPVWSRWDEYFFDGLLEFCHVERWDHMEKWVHDDRHHDQSWNDKDNIRNALIRWQTWSYEVSKYHIIESCRDDWWHDRLFPYAQESSDLLADDSHIGNEECGGIHRNGFIWAEL